MLLTVSNLSISLSTRQGSIEPVREVSFHMKQGEILGVVGESGCGKSLCNLALMGLLDKNASVCGDKMEFMGKSLLNISPGQRRKLRGRDMTMIFQDPMSALNPCLTVGRQIRETLEAHEGKNTKQENTERAHELLHQVGIAAPKKRMKSYPHELSGGMCQRVMIAQAIACNPKLLIADEPTTALDVTIQSQILDLLMNLREQKNMGILFVTHDIGVVGSISDRIQVMYAGEIVETGSAREIIEAPYHPYTQALFKSLPHYQTRRPGGTHTPVTLYNLPGMVPNLYQRPQGCQFHPRCPHSQPPCIEKTPETTRLERRSYQCLLERDSLLAKGNQR